MFNFKTHCFIISWTIHKDLKTAYIVFYLHPRLQFLTLLVFICKILFIICWIWKSFTKIHIIQAESEFVFFTQLSLEAAQFVLYSKQHINVCMKNQIYSHIYKIGNLMLQKLKKFIRLPSGSAPAAQTAIVQEAASRHKDPEASLGSRSHCWTCSQKAATVLFGCQLSTCPAQGWSGRGLLRDS